LCLKNVTLQPIVAQQDGTLGSSLLLQLLARLTALRTLQLSVRGDWPQQQLTAHSALTASSDLQHLILHADIKPAAWAHMFPAGHKLPHLHSFEAFSSAGEDGGVQRLRCADVTRLVSCCPNLQHLGFVAPTANDMRIGPQTLLQSLTGLTSLELRRMEPAALSTLSALTQLQSLDLYVDVSGMWAQDEEGAGLHHLVHLTALTGLTELTSNVADPGYITRSWEVSLLSQVSTAVGGWKRQGRPADLHTCMLSAGGKSLCGWISPCCIVLCV
jgi:hypothetical protein